MALEAQNAVPSKHRVVCVRTCGDDRVHVRARCPHSNTPKHEPVQHAVELGLGMRRRMR